MRLLTTSIFFLFLPFLLISQIGFQSSIALQADEPNRARTIIELDSSYIVGGKYFDQSLGRWEIFFSQFDELGELSWLKTLKSDTASSLIESNRYLMDKSGLLIGALRPGYMKLVKYDTELDSVFVQFKISTNNYNFIYNKFTNNPTKDTFYFSGRNKNFDTYDINLLRVTANDTTVIRTRNQNLSNNRLIPSYLEYIDDNSIVLACTEQEDLNTETIYKTYLLFFDPELNLKYNGWLAEETIPFSGNKGLLIDSKGDVVVIGSQVVFLGSHTEFYSYPAIGKYNTKGAVEWYRRLGNNIANNSQYGRWESIIESKEKDGYILVGCQIDETEFQDSLLGRAAIAKVSYEGDSLWMRTYSFRTPRVDTRDEFTDVILSSDGYYVACGASYQKGDYPEDDPWIQTIIVKMDEDGIYDSDQTSTIDLSTDNIMTVYPNPASSQLYLTQSIDKSLIGQLVDQQGRVLEEFRSDNINHTHILDVSDLEPGLYYIVASDKAGNRYTSKVVVSK